jgi:hypothetical protein
MDMEPTLGREGEMEEVSASFFEKKKQKNFCYNGPSCCHGHWPNLQKFFGYFFQKSDRFLPCPLPAAHSRRDLLENLRGDAAA